MKGLVSQDAVLYRRLVVDEFEFEKPTNSLSQIPAVGLILGETHRVFSHWDGLEWILWREAHKFLVCSEVHSPQMGDINPRRNEDS